MVKNSSILGMSLANATEAETAQLHAAVGAGLANGIFTPIIAQEFALADAPRAHEAILVSGARGKIVLSP